MALKKEIKRPKVGMGVYIIKDEKLLLTKRIGSHGANTWCPPGGHLELGESFEQCAKRETLEEAGIKIKNIRFIGTTNDIYNKDLHYVTMGMMADYASGKPRIMEPDKCADIDWFDLNKLPSPLFLPVKHFLKNYKRFLYH